MRSFLQNSGVFLLVGLGASAFWQARIIEPAALPASLANVDLFTQIYPMSHRASRMILEGDIPLWNPYQFCGCPFLATMLYGVLYPLNLLYLLFPTELAIGYTTVLHLALAGWFTFLYTRSIGLSAAGSLVGAVVFMLSGHELNQAMWYTSVLAATVWLPLALFAIERTVRRQSLLSSSILAVAVAMPILAGWLQVWVYMMYAVASYAAVHVASLLVGGKPREAARVALLVVAGVIVGLALSSVQILPTAELTGLSTREPGGVSLQQSLAGGVTDPLSLLRQALDAAPGYPRAAYLGVASLLLMPLSLLGRVTVARLAWLWAIAAASVSVALTTYTPLFDIYRMFPTGTWFRAPQRILFLYAFAGAVLAAIGAEVAMAAATQRRRRRLIVSGVLVVGAVGVLAFVGVHRPVVAYTGVLLVAGAVPLMLPAGTGRKIVFLLLMAVIGWDLWHASLNPYRHPYGGLEVLHRARHVFEYIRLRQGRYRTYIHNPSPFDYALMAKQGTLREVNVVTDYEPLSLRRYDRFFALLSGQEPAGDRRYPFAGQLLADPAIENFRLLQLMSVRFILVRSSARPFIKRLMARVPEWRPVFGVGGYIVFEARQVLPRAYVTSDLTTVPSGDRALEVLSDPSFRPRRTAVIEDPSKRQENRRVAKGHPVIPAQVIAYSADRVVVKTRSPRAGYLVLTDSYYPGWKAFVDGEAAPIQPANYLFRGVAVGSGQHTVVFSYEPWSFRVGLIGAGAGLCWLISSIFVTMRRCGLARRAMGQAPEL